MTQKQKRIAAWAIALLSAAGSLAFWASMLGILRSAEARDAARAAVPLVLPEVRAEEQAVPGEEVVEEARGSLRAAAPVLPVPEPAQREEEPEGGERADERQRPAPDGQQSELAQWGLRRGFSISIPAIQVRAPVLIPSRRFWDGGKWDLLEEQMQVGLNFGAVEYPHSVQPGKAGSLIIAGHSSPPDSAAESGGYGHLFARLPELRAGDTIAITAGGETLTYVVEDAVVVAPQETSVLNQHESESVLKLITCYPIGTTRDRLVVIAKLQPSR